MDANEQERLIEQQQHKEEPYPPHSERHRLPQWWCHLCVRRTSPTVDDGLPF